MAAIEAYSEYWNQTETYSVDAARWALDCLLPHMQSSVWTSSLTFIAQQSVSDHPTSITQQFWTVATFWRKAKHWHFIKSFQQLLFNDCQVLHSVTKRLFKLVHFTTKLWLCFLWLRVTQTISHRIVNILSRPSHVNCWQRSFLHPCTLVCMYIWCNTTVVQVIEFMTHWCYSWFINVIHD